MGKTLVAERVASKSTSFESMVEEERVNYSDINAYAGTDIDVVASRIAVEVTFALSEAVEELNVYSSDFRISLHRLAKWILVTLFENQDKCAVIPDALPGYTAMGFKRKSFQLKGVEVDYVPSLDKISVEKEAASMILNQFMEKTKNQVVVIECKDLLLILFPVNDLNANLRKLGYFNKD